MLLSRDIIQIKNEFDINWLKVFYHNSSDCDWFNEKDVIGINSKNKFSILGLIREEFKIDDYYEFLLQYPSFPGEYNHWKQKVFPLDANQSNGDNVHCDSIHTDWNDTDHEFNGLSLSSTPEKSIVDGNSGDEWWFAIGARKAYKNSINKFPGPAVDNFDPVTEVYLWIRIPTNIFRMLRVKFTCKQQHWNHIFHFIFILLAI